MSAITNVRGSREPWGIGKSRLVGALHGLRVAPHRSPGARQVRRVDPPPARRLDMIAGLGDTGIRGRLLATDLITLRVDDQLRRDLRADSRNMTVVSARNLARGLSN